MAETLMRGRFRGVEAETPHVIDEKAITDRCVAVLEMENARLCALRISPNLGGSRDSTCRFSTPNYFAPNRWSAALLDDEAFVDSIYFRSRFANVISVALCKSH